MKSEVNGTVRYGERGQGYRDVGKGGEHWLKDSRGYCHLKEEALDRTVWRDRFGRDFGPVVRQTEY
jgi:hypothetical protein